MWPTETRPAASAAETVELDELLDAVPRLLRLLLKLLLDAAHLRAHGRDGATRVPASTIAAHRDRRLRGAVYREKLRRAGVDPATVRVSDTGSATP